MLPILTAACSAGVARESFYYPTDFELARAIYEGQPVEEGPLARPWLDGNSFATYDFGAGFYTLSGVDLDFASAWARAIAARNCSDRWGVVVFEVPVERLQTIEAGAATLSFAARDSRPENAPLLPEYTSQPANWPEFVAYNQVAQDNSRWDSFAWIEGPIWRLQDDPGFTGEGRAPRLPPGARQRNWVDAAEVLNATDVDRLIFTGSAETQDMDPSTFILEPGFDPDC